MPLDHAVQVDGGLAGAAPPSEGLMTRIAGDLGERGWELIETGIKDEVHLASVIRARAMGLGTVRADRGSPVRALSPRNQEKARPSSLSAKFGLQRQPMHNDTAHWVTPARYVLLGCVDPGRHEATIRVFDTHRIPLSGEQRAMLRRSVFLVENGRHSFYTTIFSPMRPFLRVDPGCMVPISHEAAASMSIFQPNEADQMVREIRLSSGQLLLIDNWRVLHARGAVECDGGGRKLLRAMVA